MAWKVVARDLDDIQKDIIIRKTQDVMRELVELLVLFDSLDEESFNEVIANERYPFSKDLHASALDIINFRDLVIDGIKSNKIKSCETELVRC